MQHQDKKKTAWKPGLVTCSTFSIVHAHKSREPCQREESKNIHKSLFAFGLGHLFMVPFSLDVFGQVEHKGQSFGSSSKAERGLPETFERRQIQTRQGLILLFFRSKSVNLTEIKFEILLDLLQMKNKKSQMERAKKVQH